MKENLRIKVGVGGREVSSEDIQRGVKEVDKYIYEVVMTNKKYLSEVAKTTNKNSFKQDFNRILYDRVYCFLINNKVESNYLIATTEIEKEVIRKTKGLSENFDKDSKEYLSYMQQQEKVMQCLKLSKRLEQYIKQDFK